MITFRSDPDPKRNQAAYDGTVCTDPRWLGGTSGVANLHGVPDEHAFAFQNYLQLVSPGDHVTVGEVVPPDSVSTGFALVQWYAGDSKTCLRDDENVELPVPALLQRLPPSELELPQVATPSTCKP